MKKNLYLDIHVLQAVPSSNINRDDTGSPKTAIYGGVTRARVSSQSWKRAVRQMFAADGSENEGIRTTHIAVLLADEFSRQVEGVSQTEALDRAKEILDKAKVKLDKDGNTKALFFISQGQIKKLVGYALSHEEIDSKEIKKIFNDNQSLDLVLFGRMVADNPELNVEGSAQVAHALSTHEITPEFDYFTAVDDRSPEDNAGAAMLGTIEFNSSTLYRYANLNLHELRETLGDEISVEGMKEFVKSFILSMPTGKQNTFANKTLPSYVLIVLRDDTPVNLVSAFEQPVSSNDGFIKKSIERLEVELGRSAKFVDSPIYLSVLTEQSTSLENSAENMSVFLENLGKAVEKAMPNENTND